MKVHPDVNTDHSIEALRAWRKQEEIRWAVYSKRGRRIVKSGTIAELLASLKLQRLK